MAVWRPTRCSRWPERQSWPLGLRRHFLLENADLVEAVSVRSSYSSVIRRSHSGVKCTW